MKLSIGLAFSSLPLKAESEGLGEFLIPEPIIAMPSQPQTRSNTAAKTAHRQPRFGAELR